MARTYTLKQRAQQQADTRQRIVEAAVNLHSTVGPAATTVSMIAERAGAVLSLTYEVGRAPFAVLAPAVGRLAEHAFESGASLGRAIIAALT